MNYSNMIEEKSLKKTFIIATLVSTIAGTFTTGINLYDRVSDKRKQHKTDHTQDEKIKALEKRIDNAEESTKKHHKKNMDLRESLQSGGPMIRREYEQDFARMGRRFAEGDLLAQTQLQGQVITLQGTVIKILENALITGTLPDVNKLYNASEFAREGSIRALRDQYQRMMQSVPAGRPLGPVRRISSTPQLRLTAPPPPQASAMVPFNNPGPLFCRYAEMLQRTDRPLDGDFSERGCPACGSRPPVEAGRAWKLDKDVVRERVSRGKGYDEAVVEVLDNRTYALSNRFLIKCHRAGAGYACYLCFLHRDKDTLCETMETLVNHVLKKHDVKEYEGDGDIRDTTAAPLRTAQTWN